ncbi:MULTISPECIES: NAD(P)/FAD-dependent oxidoreductase [unclassified Methanosarcina]|uniref:NAD(P)/FAD-dependent oxidoreductase n=1 Tax=unclassified Methanosarcina TaxID=2644672 RepID=UPI000615CD51|nr:MULTISPECIES: NAD(P)/FAD-dependent oxidoreductase [unclassified Methanosarcina]AKB17424.1 Phytoene dehydrogenase [Methanosarcina sp. WWM596]AKB20817.1 Phytoene dehydrogenase [Methanosarcina sp. WH1]
MKIVIIGSGLAGLSAGYRLCKSNEVIIFEKDPDIGGMAASYSLEHSGKKYFIERYYHHIFRSDAELLALIKELGLEKQMLWLEAKNAYFVDGKNYPMNTPLEILHFSPLSILDLAKLGLLVLRIRLIKDTVSYDQIKAKDWIIDTAGMSVYENFFAPLMKSKFGDNAENVSAAWLIGRVKIRSDRGKEGEKLGYMRGGFNYLLEALSGEITTNGGEIRTNKEVTEIVIKDNAVQGVVVDGDFIACDAVISTVEPLVLDGITGGKLELLHDSLQNIRYQGTACALIGLDRMLMEDGNYWLNIKADVPFGAVIEHTNYLPLEDYGEHLVYVTSYFQDKKSALWTQKEENILDSYLSGLEKMFPEFSREWVRWTKLYRRTDTAPVYEQGYLKNVLPFAAGPSGLYLAGMFSSTNYPERSMNGSVKAGFESAELLTKEK